VNPGQATIRRKGQHCWNFGTLPDVETTTRNTEGAPLLDRASCESGIGVEDTDSGRGGS
jgi:hypothetical protein